MKTFMSLVAALAAVAVLAGASLAQAPTPAAPQTAATPAPANAPVIKNLTGEFVAMDKAAKTVTVKHVVDNKATQITLNVDETMLTPLAQLKVGDKVKVTYEEMGGKFIAKSIAKA